MLAAAGLFAVLTPVASAQEAPVGTPAATAIQASALKPARRLPVTQIGPYIPERPPVPEGTGAGRRVVYCNSCQYVWVIDHNNTVIRSYLVSGRQFWPSPGTYSILLKQRYTFATNNPSITWEYMVTFAHGPNGGGIGFHEIPWQYGHRVQTDAQLGQFLSGGCVRQTHDDAVFMWEWSQVGDTVVVTA